ncbi:MAG TPA: MaoC/PaaZ C-terminal domain-containing protein, partial [Blastocatellia bacterium]
GILIAHGLIGSTRVLDDTLVSVLRLGWNFFNPIKIKDRLHVKMTVAEKKDVKSDWAGLITFQIETINQREQVVNRCTRSVLVARRTGQTQRESCRYVFMGLADLELEGREPSAAPSTHGGGGPRGDPSSHPSSQKEPAPPKGERRGKYFEEFEIGEQLMTDARTVTEADVINYTMLSWETDPLHTDAEYGRRAGYGGLVAPVLLPIVFANGLGATLGYLAGTNRGALGDWWEFINPVRVGDTLRFRQAVAEKRDAKDAETGIVTYGMEMIDEHGTVVSRGERSALVARLPEGEAKPWKFMFGTSSDLAKKS